MTKAEEDQAGVNVPQECGRAGELDDDDDSNEENVDLHSSANWEAKSDQCQEGNEYNSPDDDSSENTATNELSSLERRRLERIRRNQERLASLGLDNPMIKPAMQPKKRDRKKKVEVEPNEIRKSSRRTKKNVNYAELVPRGDNLKPLRIDGNETKRAKVGKKGKGERLNRFIYDEFCKIKARKKMELKVAEKRVRSADVEYKFIARKVEIASKKAKRREDIEKIGAQIQLEKKVIGSTVEELCQEVDSRREELKWAVHQFDKYIMTAGKFKKQQMQQQEYTRKIETIDAMNRFPISLKNVVQELNLLLYQRSPRDLPPSRRCGRKRKSNNEANECVGKRMKVEHEEGAWNKLAVVALKEKQGKSDNPVDSDGVNDEQSGKRKKIRKRRARNVGGWVSPMFSKTIDRSWLEKDYYDSNVNGSTYVPQAGDIVLYYPVGHRSFLEMHPDKIGEKVGNKMRMPLWERAQKERDVQSSVKSESIVDEYKWWNKEWLEGVNGHLGIYPLICSVEKTHSEFPPDPDSDNTRTIKDSEGNKIIVFENPKSCKRNKKKCQSKAHLCLAVTLKPMSPLLPPVWNAGTGKLQESELLSPPPPFQVVIFPSKCASFIVPFSKAYKMAHSLALEDKVTWAKESQWNFLVEAFTNLGGEYGTFRLDDKTESIASILSIFKDTMNTSVATLVSSLTLSNPQKFSHIPLADSATIIETLAKVIDAKNIVPGPQANVEITDRLITLIRGTLPLWNGVTVVRGKRKPSQVSAWELVQNKVVEMDHNGIVVNSIVREHVFADNGLIYQIDENLRKKLECSLEDFVKNNDEADDFVEAVTDDIAPSYSCAVPLGMCFRRVLRRLSCRKLNFCFYRTVASLLDDIDSILDNSVLYNSPDSDIVQTGLRIISKAKAIITQVANQHQKEINIREKADEERQRKILQQCNSAAIVSSQQLNLHKREFKTSKSTQNPRKISCNQSMSPFLERLERKWLERADRDSSWHPSAIVNNSTHENIQNVTEISFNVDWVPQGGDYIVYSRSLHHQFIRGHYESLTTEQCKLAQFIVLDEKSDDILGNHTANTTTSRFDSGLLFNIKDIGADTINSSWLLGKIVWVKRVFPRQFRKVDETKNTSGFDVLSPLLSIGICFDVQKQNIQTIHWRPCQLSSSLGGYSASCGKCSKCNIPFSFLLPAWLWKDMNYGDISDQGILIPQGASGGNIAQFEKPSGLLTDDIASIGRCLNSLKRRCLNLIPPDFVDENFTLDNVKKGWKPLNKMDQTALPTFEDEIGIRKSGESERASNRNLVNQRKRSNKEDKQDTIPILAGIHYIPPFTPQQSKFKTKGKENGQPKKQLLYEETMTPSPNLCLELVLHRLKSGYYRQKSAIVDDLQEAYVTSTLLVLSKQASQKFVECSARKISKFLSTHPLNLPFSTRARKKKKKKDATNSQKHPQMNDLEVKWVEKIKEIRSLYAMAIVATTEHMMVERILGTTPKKASSTESIKEPSANEFYSMQVREKISYLLSSLGHDPCINRAAQIHTNLGSEGSMYPCATLKISSRFRLCDNECEMAPILFVPQDVMTNDNLVRIFFGIPGRMYTCARCQALRRSMYFCRVQKKHYNKDFNWLQQMKDVGGVEGLLFSLRHGMPYSVSSPPRPSPSQLLLTEPSYSLQEKRKYDNLIALHKKAKQAVGIANDLCEEAKQNMASAPKLSDEFIRNNFPVDPEDGHYNYCSICGLSGDVVCCDKCPMVMHPGCAGLDAIPEGDWFCTKCSRIRSDDENTSDAQLRSTSEIQLETLLADLRSFRHSDIPTHGKKNKTIITKTDHELKDDSKNMDGQVDDTSKHHSVAEKSAHIETKKAGNDGEVIFEDTTETSSLSAGGKDNLLAVMKDKDKSSPKNAEEEVWQQKQVSKSNESTNVVQSIRIGSKISKQFGNQGFFLGVVRSLPNNEHPFYGIKYEDGDEEDMDESEIRSVLITQKTPKEPERVAEKSKGNARKRRKKNNSASDRISKKKLKGVGESERHE